MMAVIKKIFNGDPYENWTRASRLKIWRLSHLTNGPGIAYWNRTNISGVKDRHFTIKLKQALAKTNNSNPKECIKEASMQTLSSDD